MLKITTGVSGFPCFILQRSHLRNFNNPLAKATKEGTTEKTRITTAVQLKGVATLHPTTVAVPVDPPLLPAKTREKWLRSKR